jgi:hypothetical protein
MIFFAILDVCGLMCRLGLSELSDQVVASIYRGLTVDGRGGAGAFPFTAPPCFCSVASSARRAGYTGGEDNDGARRLRAHGIALVAGVVGSASAGRRLRSQWAAVRWAICKRRSMQPAMVPRSRS